MIVVFKPIVLKRFTLLKGTNEVQLWSWMLIRKPHTPGYMN